MKRMLHNAYVHVSNLSELYQFDCKDMFELFDHAWRAIPCPFQVVKFNLKDRYVTLVVTPTWDTYYEPVIERVYTFKPNGGLTIQQGSMVYHQKHLFVSPDYTGFDIEASKARTALIESIPEITENKFRIGSTRIWQGLLKKYNLPIKMG